MVDVAATRDEAHDRTLARRAGGGGADVAATLDEMGDVPTTRIVMQTDLSEVARPRSRRVVRVLAVWLHSVSTG